MLEDISILHCRTATSCCLHTQNQSWYRGEETVLGSAALCPQFGGRSWGKRETVVSGGVEGMAGVRPFKVQGSCPMRGHISAVPLSLDRRHHEEGPCWHKGKRQVLGLESGSAQPRPGPKEARGPKLAPVGPSEGCDSNFDCGNVEKGFQRKGNSFFHSSILNLLLSLMESIPRSYLYFAAAIFKRGRRNVCT